MTEPDRPKASAIVVTWNSAHEIGACLRSLGAARDEISGDLEIIVVDNDSRDETVEVVRRQAPDARLIRAHRNLGYGSAANVGFAEALGDLLLLMNPDVVLEPGGLRAMTRRLRRDPHLACVSPLYIDSDAQLPARSFPTIGVAIADGTWLERWLRQSAVLRRYYRDGMSSESPPDWLHGPCLCFRREAIASGGGFDAGYFMYAEELDLLRDLRAAGWTCAIEPGARARHLGGASADRDPVAREQNFFRSRYRLARKTWGRPFALALRVFVALTGLLRLAEESIKLVVRDGRDERAHELRRIARVTLWQWLGWRR